MENRRYLISFLLMGIFVIAILPEIVPVTESEEVYPYSNECIVASYYQPAEGFILGADWYAMYYSDNLDTNALIWANFFVVTGGNFKVMFVYANTQIANCAGHILISAFKDSEGRSWLVTNEDIVLDAPIRVTTYIRNSSYFTVENMEHVSVQFSKTDNAGGKAGYLELYGMWLIRQ